MGGACAECGTTSELEIDHVDARTKKFNINGWHRSQKEIEKELKKCQVLCRSCHFEKSRKDIAMKARRPQTHGTNGYARGCRCTICKDARRIQRREQYERTGN